MNVVSLAGTDACKAKQDAGGEQPAFDFAWLVFGIKAKLKSHIAHRKLIEGEGFVLALGAAAPVGVAGFFGEGDGFFEV